MVTELSGGINSETAHVLHCLTLTLTVNIFQILLGKTLPPRNTSYTCSAGIPSCQISPIFVYGICETIIFKKFPFDI